MCLFSLSSSQRTHTHTHTHTHKLLALPQAAVICLLGPLLISSCCVCVLVCCLGFFVWGFFFCLFWSTTTESSRHLLLAEARCLLALTIPSCTALTRTAGRCSGPSRLAPLCEAAPRLLQMAVWCLAATTEVRTAYRALANKSGRPALAGRSACVASATVLRCCCLKWVLGL